MIIALISSNPEYIANRPSAGKYMNLMAWPEQNLNFISHLSFSYENISAFACSI